MRACTQCGKCCAKYGVGSGLGSATSNDVKLWRKARPQVLRYTDALGDLWISPVTGEETSRCPWLRKLPLQEKYKCRIHEVRPTVCREYPINIDQMIEDKCEMLEELDLSKPRANLIRELEALRNASAS